MVMGDIPEASGKKNTKNKSGSKSRQKNTTDVVVVGGGPGGYACAFRAADLGLKVTLINDETQLGGVCLLRGCIPSKALLHLSELILTSRQSSAMGIEFQDPTIDLKKLRNWKEELVDSLAEGIEQLGKQRKITQIQAKARFKSAQEIELQGSDHDTLHFQHAVIATGSRPVSLPGTEIKENGRIMDSSGALALKDIPETLLVIGGGYVGLELGMVYATLGSQVTLVEMTDRLMPNADPDLVQPVVDKVAGLFEAIHLNTKVTKLDEQDNEVKVALESPEDAWEARFERVLVAIGRRPNSDGLGLDTVGVEMDDKGFVVIDDRQRTNVDTLLAIGDVAGGMQLAHEAMYEGKIAAEVIAGEPAAFDARAIPAVVYTDPQIAWCGLTEQQAQAQDRPVKIVQFPWQASGRARSMGATGLTKLILDPDNGRLLGMGITGREAEALIAEGVLAMEMGAVARDLAMTIHPHPTLSETLGEAAELFLGGATHFTPAKS